VPPRLQSNGLDFLLDGSPEHLLHVRDPRFRLVLTKRHVKLATKCAPESRLVRPDFRRDPANIQWRGDGRFDQVGDSLRQGFAMRFREFSAELENPTNKHFHGRSGWRQWIAMCTNADGSHLVLGHSVRNVWCRAYTQSVASSISKARMTDRANGVHGSDRYASEISRAPAGTCESGSVIDSQMNR
jgi:hypothetical protein